MQTIDVYTYPDGKADQLAQDDIVSRLQPNGRFTDTYVGELVEGDQYCIPEKKLPMATDTEILDLILEGNTAWTVVELANQKDLLIYEKDSLDDLAKATLHPVVNATEAECLRGLFRELMSEVIHNRTL
jgi:hypothetical protein